MDRDGSYAAVVIPADFTASLLELAGEKASGPRYGRPQILILTNQRAGPKPKPGHRRAAARPRGCVTPDRAKAHRQYASW